MSPYVGPSYQEQSSSLAVRTRESDEEDEAIQDPIMENSDDSTRQSNDLHAVNEDEFQDGMLPRDVPKRTTFYDPVAERQMTQTDAKLFYQRSKIDTKTGSGIWSQSPPHGSPIMISDSYAATEYGGDSQILDHDGGLSDLAIIGKA